MAMNASYAQAHQHLLHILAAPQFRPVPQPKPWWQPVLDWLRSHIHFSLGQGNWRTVAWVLGGVIALAFSLIVLVWLRDVVRRGRVEKVARRAVSTDQPWLDQATAAFEAHEDRFLLHALMEASLLFASAQGWLRYARHKTARAYRRELVRTAVNPDFMDWFTVLCDSTEAVLFARLTLSRTTAAWLLTQAQQLLAPARQPSPMRSDAS